MDTEKHLRTIKSYVVRGGRLTQSQQNAMEALWPSFGLERHNGLINAQDIFGNDHPLVFEIGFGMGESLAQMAQASPDQNFIGVDVHPPGIGTLLRKVDELGLTNVRVFQDDANLVLANCIADNSLDKVQIYFPDPWHKKRHHKRRLIQEAFIHSLLPKLKSNALLHLATDWENYAEQMMEALESIEALENINGKGQYSGPDERPSTKFQRRGEKLGHGVWDLLFKKN